MHYNNGNKKYIYIKKKIASWSLESNTNKFLRATTGINQIDKIQNNLTVGRNSIYKFSTELTCTKPVFI